MSTRHLIGFIVAQHGAPGPASGVSYDIKVNEDEASVIYRGVIPSTPRPPDEIDVGPILPNRAVEVWEVDGVMHFMFTEYPHTAECDAPAPLPSPVTMSTLLQVVALATPTQRTQLARALGVK